MEKEIKNCQNCKKDFIIEPEDFAFYEKMKVPSPTFCPECRLILRLNWRNEKSLYWGECDLCKTKTLSIYGKGTAFPVYCHSCWWSDKWDPMQYSQEYDQSKYFLAQLKELSQKVPRLCLNVVNVTDSPYINQVWNSKNVYMSFDIGYSENILYSKACHYMKDSCDCTYSKKLELCYESINSKETSRSSWIINCEGCFDSYFLKNCKHCSSCILCTNLKNKKYHILNVPYTKEEYEKIKKEYIDGSFGKYKKSKELFNNLIQKSIHKENENMRAVDCSGNYIWDSKNCKYSFNIFKSENCKFINDVDADLKDSMDVSNSAEAELLYNSIVVGAGANMVCCYMGVSSLNIYYSLLCAKNNSNLFGCVSLKDKNYCILNKQYTKEEYEKLVPQIIKQMNDMPYTNSRGIKFYYGDFFPIEFSPFCYNETICQDVFPLTKEQAIEQGYSWKDPEQRNYQITMKTDQIPDNIKDITDDILNQVIECEHKGTCNEQCTEAFRIIPQELQFYRKMNLPIPRLCPNCRHYQRLKQRNPLKLWKRQCMCNGSHSSNNLYQNTCEHNHKGNPCPNTFETSYSKERPEIVYCEECYLKEVA